ncbi:MAG TPA: porin [Gammaproteobacteria bacterium]|nr:porin [Gammaproteobacteria bacterium]
MYRKLIAFAVTSALMAPLAAQADAKPKVEFYGQLQVEVAKQDSKGVSATVVDDNKRGRLGVKASEDLGDGMKAIAQFEWQVDTSDANATDGRRIGMVGLQGSFGTITSGSLMSPYKYTGGVKYDPFVTTFLEARSKGGMSGKIESAIAAKATGMPDSKGSFGHHSFIHNAVSYSIKHKSLSFSIVYSPDQQGDARGADGDYATALKYKRGSMESFIAATNDASNKMRATKVGGRYTTGKHAIMGQYEKIDAAGTNVGVLFMGYHYMLGKNMLVAQLGNTSIDQVGKDDIKYYALGVIHMFSKRTRLFTGYRNTDNGDANKDSAFSVGLRFDF